MKDQMDFPAIVMLVDAVMLNTVVVDFKKNFGRMLQRPIQDMDVAQFVVNLALDAGIAGQDHRIQIILVYDDSIRKLNHCAPSVLETELNGVAFQDALGEFSFASISPSGMTTRQELFLDLLNIIGESTDVTQMVVAPPAGEALEHTINALSDINKEITLFCMEQSPEKHRFEWMLLGYPVMQAMGIRGEEL